MNNEIIIQVLTSILDGLAGVMLAGFVIWFWQIKYTERKNKVNLLLDRRYKEEDIFYNNFREAKNKLYELFLILSNEHNITQEHVDGIVSSIQQCVNQINISRVALGKYEAGICEIFCKYNEFSNLFTESLKQIGNLSPGQIYELNEEIKKIKDDIFLEIDKVDKMYFFQQI